MAPRRGEITQEPTLGGLQFNEPLSWRAGKPIPTGTLLQRLDALSNELREMDQEETDKDSLTAVAKELVGPNLLNHKDKGVRAFTACCLVDVLKICAPDAPFTGSQLKDIFTLFIVSILPALSDPSNTYNTQQKYVLVSLAEVKSIVLLMDIPNSEALTLHLFSSFFDALSGSAKTSTGEHIAKDIQYHMTQMLVTLVDEAESLPTQVVDIIVAQFLRATTPGGGKSKDAQMDERQSTLLLKELPEAYNMAQTICNSCPEKMARYISQYFNDVIMDVSTSSNGPSKTNGHRRQSDAVGSDDEEVPAGPTEADMKELHKAHRLLRELWRASPAVLQNVIPQLEAELSAENVQLRLLATETLGDIISGIGAAGPPPPPTMDPAVYPPVKLDDFSTTPTSNSILTTPISPQSFAQTHPGVYQSFLGRRNDKSLVIRTGWTTAIGRILVTSAGGIGLSREEEATLVKALAEKLNDSDEKVRLAAVKSIAGFNLRDIMIKLASDGDVSTSGSVLCSLADRVRDRKHIVRVEAMTTLGRIWGVASGEIAAGNDSVTAALGNIPTRIFDAYYANDLELNVLLDHVMFEQLIPLSYPPKKIKSKAANGNSQTNGDGPFDADKIRVERILLVVKSLDAKSKKAFFAIQGRQPTFAKVLQHFLKRCEEYNGGVTDGDAKEIKMKLDGVIQWFGSLLPDPLRTTNELQKYAKMHDRRSYQLLRFSIAHESDFKTVYNSIKEFSKRIESAPTAPAGLLDTLMPIIYRSALLVYNKSHLPAIMQYARSDDNGLGATAHELNHEISEKLPDIFKSNVKELCKLLQDDVPSETRSNDADSVETLRTLAQFAKGGSQDLPKDRKFIQALFNYALYSVPAKSAKYAVSILLVTTGRKEMYAKDLLAKTTEGWTYGEGHFLTKLATMSQLTLLDPKMTDDANDKILDITTQQILLQVRTPAKDTDHSWQLDSVIDEECEAKCWALKILVNRLRTTEDAESAKKLAGPVYKLLNILIAKEGELSKKNDTPKHHKSRLRLLAAQLMLKLCTKKMFDDILTHTEFIRLACVAQDALSNVRRGFIEKVQKYLVKGKLSNRFYTIMFLTAFEPNLDFKKSIVTWICSQAKLYHQKKSQVMEGIFARLLSLLAHHPDYSEEPDNLKDHTRYILYYLNAMASEDNLGLIYKYAERVKQARDGINANESKRLYVLSDLAQAVIRKWELKKGWRMQTYPGKVPLPAGLFSAMGSHEEAQKIAETDFLPDGMDEILDGVVKNANKKVTKRKADEIDEDGNPTKKLKSESKLRSARTPTSKATREKKAPRLKKRSSSESLNTPAPSSADRRRSGRGASTKKSYADRDDSEDDEEMMDGVAQWEYVDEDGDSDAEEAAARSPSPVGSPSPKAKRKPAPKPKEETLEPKEMTPEESSPPTHPTPRSNGKKTAAPTSSQSKPGKLAKKPLRESIAKSSPLNRPPPAKASPATSRVTKLKPKSPLVPAKAALSAAKPAVGKVKAAAGKAKGKRKRAAVKDVFDMDDSD